MLEVLAGLVIGAAFIALFAWAAVHEIIPTYPTAEEGRAVRQRAPWDVRR